MSDSVVVFLSGDLLFASRVRAAVENAGKTFQFSGSVPENLDQPITHVILDLSTRSKAAEGLMPICKQVCPEATVLAYGPHVQVERLKAARLAGIPTVLTRGQFDASLGTLFQSS